MHTNTRTAATLPAVTARETPIRPLATYLARRLAATRAHLPTSPAAIPAARAVLAEIAALADLLDRAERCHDQTESAARAWNTPTITASSRAYRHHAAMWQQAGDSARTATERRTLDVAAAEMEILADQFDGIETRRSHAADIAELDDLIRGERALHEETIERARRAENLLRGIRLMARQWSVYPLDGFDDGPAAETLGKVGRALLDLLGDEPSPRPAYVNGDGGYLTLRCTRCDEHLAFIQAGDDLDELTGKRNAHTCKTSEAR